MWIEGPGPDFTTVVIKYHPSATPLHYKTLIFYIWEYTMPTGVGNSLYNDLVFLLLNLHRVVFISMFWPYKAYFFSSEKSVLVGTFKSFIEKIV